MTWDTNRRPRWEYIPAGKARRILTRDSHRCYQCGGDATEVDHLIP